MHFHEVPQLSCNFIKSIDSIKVTMFKSNGGIFAPMGGFTMFNCTSLGVLEGPGTPKSENTKFQQFYVKVWKICVSHPFT